MKREKGVEMLCEQIIGENFPNLGKDTDIKIQEAHRTPIRFNKTRPSTMHIIVKFTNYPGKERIMKAAREKKVPNLQGKTDQVCSRPIPETWQARKEWQDIFNVLNQQNMQPRILYPERLSFKIEERLKVSQTNKN